MLVTDDCKCEVSAIHKEFMGLIFVVLSRKKVMNTTKLTQGADVLGLKSVTNWLILTGGGQEHKTIK